MSTKLLISIKDVSELEDAALGGADIIDVKDPSSGSLGLPEFVILKDVVDAVKSSFNKEVSVALGDLNRYDRSLNYIVFSVSTIGVDYIKLGMALRDEDEIKYIVMNASNIASLFGKSRVVLVGYADYAYEGFIEPIKLIDVATSTKVCGVMIDTFKKNGNNTFNLLTADYLERFVLLAHSQGLLAAVAGGINIEHLPLCTSLGFDVVGVRGAVCVGKRSGKVYRERVKMFKEAIKRLSEAKNSTAMHHVL